MRPIANFTVHAILAAAIAALATASAAAAGTEQIYYTIKLQEAHVAGARSPAADSRHIDVISFQWGSSAARYKLDRGFVKSWSTSGDADAPPPGGGTNQISADDTAGKERATKVDGLAVKQKPVEGGSVGGSKIITADGNRTETAQATGKRTHMPLRMRHYYDTSTPPPSGSLTVLASGTPCRVGARYPSLQLSGGGKSYMLQDVRVASCDRADDAPEESITFVYGKVGVRGWDPKKKEQ